MRSPDSLLTEVEENHEQQEAEPPEVACIRAYIVKGEGGPRKLA